MGVVDAIAPWNFPFAIGQVKAPAIARGNTVVMKPATEKRIKGELRIEEM